jgi:hypothetical protein
MAAAVAMSAAALALVGLPVHDLTHEAKLNTLTVADLKTVCAHFGLAPAGGKAALTESIHSHKLVAAGAAGAGGGGGAAPVAKPCTQGALASMTDADLRQLCTQEGVDATGAEADVQARMAIHLFGAPSTPTETVQALCGMDFALALLTALQTEGDTSSHSIEGVWIARALHFALGKQVTVKAVQRRKVKFTRPEQAHEEVVFAKTMKLSDPGFTQFIEAWVAELTQVVPLPVASDVVTAEDAEGTLVDVLKVQLASPGPKVAAGEVTKTPGLDPGEWLQHFQRVTTTGKPADDSVFYNADLSKAIAALRAYGFFVDKSGVPRLYQLVIIQGIS